MSHDVSVGSVDVGTWVKMVERGSDDVEIFHIVEKSSESNYLKNKIAPDNPLGCALLGSMPGEEVPVDGPNGTLRFLILEVGQQ